MSPRNLLPKKKYGLNDQGHIKFSLMMEKLDEVSSKIEEFIEGS